MDEVLAMSWKGDIPTVKALLDHYTHWVYADRKVLRKQVFWGEALPDLKETLFRVWFGVLVSSHCKNSLGFLDL